MLFRSIGTAFVAEHAADYERPIVNRWVGSLLRRLGISLYKSNGVFVILPGQEKRIAALAVRYGVGDILAENPGESAKEGAGEQGSGTGQGL